LEVLLDGVAFALGSRRIDEDQDLRRLVPRQVTDGYSIDPGVGMNLKILFDQLVVGFQQLAIGAYRRVGSAYDVASVSHRLAAVCWVVVFH
jgi:hypothetical protein